MRTTFTRQMVLICALLLFAFGLLAAGMQTSMTAYGEAQRRSTLETNAHAVADLASAYSSAHALEGSWDFQMSMHLASEVGGTDAVVCNADGVVIACACRDFACAHLGKTIDDDLLAQTLAGGEVFASQTLSLYEDERYVCAVALTDARETAAIGAVVVSSPTAEIASSVRGMLATLWGTAAAIFAVAFVVTFFVSRREARPLRELAQTVRRFGRGDWAARAAVGGGNTAEMNDLASAFNTMAETLAEAEQRRAEFIANVSHELKTPMTSIAGYMDGMLDGTIPQAQHAQYMRLVADEVRRLSRLVRNMLDLSRIQAAGVDEEAKTVFDLGDLVGQTLFSFEQKIEARHLNVEAELPDGPLRVRAMRDAIAQVTYNLLDNAVKFCDEGGTLGVSVRSNGEKAFVTVRNTGATIPPEELPLIFDRFHKTDKSRSRDRDGVGLGLWIVKTLVGAHGEDVWVESRDGVTSFTFTLPPVK